MLKISQNQLQAIILIIKRRVGRLTWLSAWWLTHCYEESIQRELSIRNNYRMSLLHTVFIPFCTFVFAFYYTSLPVFYGMDAEPGLFWALINISKQTWANIRYLGRRSLRGTLTHERRSCSLHWCRIHINRWGNLSDTDVQLQDFKSRCFGITSNSASCALKYMKSSGGEHNYFLAKGV